MFDNGIRKLFEAYVKVSWQRIRRLTEAGIIEHGLDRPYEELASSLCPICRLFGSQYHGGSLHLTDLVPEGLSKAVYTAVRSHVSIERARGIRSAHQLYRVEYVEPGTRFMGYATILPDTTGPRLGMPEAVEAWERAMELFRELISYLNKRSGYIALGGSKSRGYGLARIEIKEIT